MNIDGNKLLKELYAVALLFFSCFLILSLLSYSPQDPSFNQQQSSGYIVKNHAGIVGAYLAGFFVDTVGLGSLFVSFLFLWGGFSLFFPQLRLKWYRWLGILFIFLCIISWASYPWLRNFLVIAQIQGGGFFGQVLYTLGITYLHSWGYFLISLFLFIAGLQLCSSLSWCNLGRKISNYIWNVWRIIKKLFFERIYRTDSKVKITTPSEQKKTEKSSKKVPAQKIQLITKKEQEHFSPKRFSEVKENSDLSKEAKENSGVSSFNSTYPAVDLLQTIPEDRHEENSDNLKQLSEKLSACLLEFGIQGEVVDVKPGPVVTMFEFRPAPGVKISKIANLHDDLALALKATAVRIEAPIPGKDIVGIEIPNKQRNTVYFRSIVESDLFHNTKLNLPMALGQDIQGNPRVEDLSRMPHLLVAGATGAGKSVCLNSIIISLLFKSSPEEMKLLLIDPKRIEMACFAELPHLVHPVVTEMELAKTALDWAVYEMEQRYEAMAKLSVRNIEGFNKKLKELQKKEPETVEDQQPLPYLVLIIDELADLMLTAGKEVEASIVRLAQLARAAGIHLILATQRPSVDVVTGLIKANFPARIAFQVSSKHDSRTILDTVGAQYLLGKGDMLFKSSAGKLDRIHGAFISDDEISVIIDFWKKKHPSSKKLDLQEWKNETGIQNKQYSEDDVLQDPMYEEAKNFVFEQGKASISMIQRQLRIGFNRAARFVEKMEKEGIIGSQEGSKPRTVIK